MIDTTDRHPDTVAIAEHFSQGGAPADLRQRHQGTWVASRIDDLAEELIYVFADDPELVTGLRKLLEARDCFGRLADKVDRQLRATG